MVGKITSSGYELDEKPFPFHHLNINKMINTAFLEIAFDK